MNDSDNETADQSEAETIPLERTTKPLESINAKVGPYLQSLSNGLIQFANKIRDEETMLAGKEVESRLASVLSEMADLARTVSLIHLQPSDDSDFCLGCICEFLKRTTTRNASELQKFNSGKGCHLYFESTAAKLSSIPLGEHMKRLKSGDHYDVISDIASWVGGGLKEFRDQTKTAVAKGVFVRRVFNLMLQHAVRPVQRKDIETVLSQHLKDSEEWNKANRGRYDVAVIGTPNIPALENADPSVTDDEFATEVHFGIFSRAGEGKALIEYRVRSANVSKMTLSNDKEAIRNHLRTFETVWGVAPKLSQALLDSVVPDYKKWTTPP
jgi:hypothetical protein